MAGPSGGTISGEPTLRTLRSVVLGLLTIGLVVLLVTGIALFFLYRPTPDAAWRDVYDAEPGGSSSWLRTAHRWASFAMVPTALAAAVVLVIGRLGRRRTGAIAAVAVVLGVALASFTGYLLPWDQLALSSVTPGKRYDGFDSLFDDDIRFVLVDGAEVSPGTVLGWLAVHALIGLALLVASAGAAWSSYLRRS